MRKYLKYFLFVIVLIPGSLLAQITGKIELKELGINIIIPEGWQAWETEEGLAASSTASSFTVNLSLHDNRSSASLKSEMELGLNEPGMSLKLINQLESIHNTGWAGEYEGKIMLLNAKAYFASLVNPYGQGVTVYCSSLTRQYTSQVPEIVHLFIEGISFFEPVQPTVVQSTTAEVDPSTIEAWKQKFNDAKLTYMHTYSSGSSGGFSDKIEIHICSKGYFIYKSRSTVSVDTGGAFGYGSGGDAGDGSWEIVAGNQGYAVLRLKFKNGNNVYEYNLSSEDGKTFLNDRRYFVTYASEGRDYAPNCN